MAACAEHTNYGYTNYGYAYYGYAYYGYTHYGYTYYGYVPAIGAYTYSGYTYYSYVPAIGALQLHRGHELVQHHIALVVIAEPLTRKPRLGGGG